MPQESTRTGAGPSWPLRVILGLCVSALVIVGFQLRDEHRSPAAITTTTPHSTSSTTSNVSTTTKGPSSSTSPTTTQPPGRSTNLPPPIVNMTAFKAPGAGCYFSTGAPSPTDGTTATSTTTTLLPDTVARSIGHCTVLEIGDSLGT